MTSKTAAARHARDALATRWHRILDECLRIRHATTPRSLYPTPFARRTDALDFTAATITASLALR